MAIARLQVHGPRPSGSGDSVDDAVELYQRTYSTLLRSSGETRLGVLEPSHRARGSSLHPPLRPRGGGRRRRLLAPPPRARGPSLHPLADSDELALGAFLYAIRRLPA